MKRVTLAILALALTACDRPAAVAPICDHAVEAATEYRAIFSPMLDTPVRYSRDIKTCESLGGAPGPTACASAMEHRAQHELPLTVVMLQLALADRLLARYGLPVPPVEPGSCAAAVREVWL